MHVLSCAAGLHTGHGATQVCLDHIWMVSWNILEAEHKQWGNLPGLSSVHQRADYQHCESNDYNSPLPSLWWTRRRQSNNWKPGEKQDIAVWRKQYICAQCTGPYLEQEDEGVTYVGMDYVFEILIKYFVLVFIRICCIHAVLWTLHEVAEWDLDREIWTQYNTSPWPVGCTVWLWQHVARSTGFGFGRNKAAEYDT